MSKVAKKETRKALKDKSNNNVVANTDDEFEESNSFHKSPKRSKRATKIKPSQSAPVDLSTDDEFEESDSFHKSPKRSKSTARTKIKPPPSSGVELTSKHKPLIWKVDGLSQTTRRRKKNNNNNFLDVVSGFSSGNVSRTSVAEAARRPILDQLGQFQVYRSITPFNRRVTSMAWHPTNPTTVAVGSKGGDMILWDYNNKDLKGSLIQDSPGGSIQALEFDQINPNQVYTASIDGSVVHRCVETGKVIKTLLEYDMPAVNWDKWYTGLDVCFTGKVIVVGNNSGQVDLLTLDGTRIWTQRLHKTKCNHVQFSDREPWMMVTTSVDKTAKVWDIRAMSGPQSALATLQHDKPVNSAYFSPVSGDRLLTTDQHSQLRVYQAPFFHLASTIVHPHRQFQHLTPIRATWHSLADIALAGRYPDPALPGHRDGERRTIDFFNPDTGAVELQLYQPGMDKIISLSQVNPAGDTILSGMGQSVMVWRLRQQEEEEDEAPLSRRREKDLWPTFKPEKRKAAVKTKKIKNVE